MTDILLLLRVFFAPLFCILLLNFLTISITKQKFGTCLPFTLIISVLTEYFGQLVFGTFNIGLFLIIIGAMAGGFLFILNRHKRDIYCTSGLAAFFAIYFLISIINFKRSFFDFDEFWHWGMMVKEMLRLDSFYCVDASNLIIHKDYPPFLALFEALWCRLTGAYSEGRVTAALHTFTLSLIVPPLAEKIIPKVRSFESSMLLAILFFLIIAGFDAANIENTILADIPIAVIFSYSMLLIITEDCYRLKFGYLQLAASLTALVMVKQIGLAMFLVAVLTYFVFGLQQKPRKISIHFLLTAIIFFIPYFINHTWTSYVKNLDVTDIRSIGTGNGQFDFSKIEPTRYINAVTGNTRDLLFSTFRNLIHAFFETDIADVSVLPITYVSAFLIICILLFALTRCFKDNFPTRKALPLGSVLFVGTIGFAFMLSVLFLFCFTPDEMQELRGYERYVDSYIIGEIVLITLLAFHSYSNSEKGMNGISTGKVLLLTTLAAIILNPANLDNLLPQAIKESSMEDTNQQFIDASDIINNKVPEGVTVGMLYDSNQSYGDAWSAQCYLQYYSNDKKISPMLDYSDINFSDKDAVKQLIQNIGMCEYLYLGNTNDQVNLSLDGLYDGNQLLNNSVYLVENSNGKVHLSVCN